MICVSNWELGYEFTLDDLKINIDEDREMSDAELEKVAGGFWAEIYQFMVEVADFYMKPCSSRNIDSHMKK